MAGPSTCTETPPLAHRRCSLPELLTPPDVLLVCTRDITRRSGFSPSVRRENMPEACARSPRARTVHCGRAFRCASGRGHKCGGWVLVPDLYRSVTVPLAKGRRHTGTISRACPHASSNPQAWRMTKFFLPCIPRKLAMAYKCARWSLARSIYQGQCNVVTYSATMPDALAYVSSPWDTTQWY